MAASGSTDLPPIGFAKGKNVVKATVTSARTSSIDVGIFETLMSAVGTPALGRALLDCANHIAPVEELFGFELPDGLPPQPVGWMGSRADALSRVQRYTQHFHELDPLIRDIRRRGKPTTLFVKRTKAEAIADPEYRWHCYEKPGFSEKISVAKPFSGGWMVINFYRRAPALHGPEFEMLIDFASCAFSAVFKHGAMMRTEDGHAGASTADRAQAKLARTFPSLTPRETRVCALTLLGATTETIAKELNIGATSVLTYRRRAYARLGIKRASELVAYLLE